MAAMDRIQISVKKNVGDMAHHTANIVSDDVYAYNKKFYEGYQWIAALDKGTCLICAALDNKFFEFLPEMEGESYEKHGVTFTTKTKENTMPERPIHPNCRCEMNPIIRGGAERALSRPNYEQWFSRLGKEDQLKLLGAARYKEFAEGRIRVTEFTKDNQIMTLKDLQISRISRADVLGIDYRPIARTANERKAEKRVEVFEKKNPGVRFAMPLNTRKEITDTITKEYNKLAERYPVNGNLIKRITMKPMRGKFGGDVGGSYTFFSNEGTIAINSSLFTNKTLYTPFLKETIIHEFGHAADLLYEKQFGKKANEALIEILGKDWRKISPQLSVYAGIVSRMKIGAIEFFAEAFKLYHQNKLDAIKDIRARELIRGFFDGWMPM